METLAKLIEILSEIPYGTVAWKEVEEHAEAYLAAFVFAFGVAHLHPKFHGMLHIGDELRRLGFLLSCWLLGQRAQTQSG